MSFSAFRSWNMISCYLANLDASINKQFSKAKGSKLSLRTIYDCFQPRTQLHANVYVNRCPYASWKRTYDLWQHYSLHILISYITCLSRFVRVSLSKCRVMSLHTVVNKTEITRQLTKSLVHCSWFFQLTWNIMVFYNAYFNVQSFYELIQKVFSWATFVHS